MNEQNGVRMTYANLLTTLVVAAGMLVWINNIAKAGDATAADLDKHVAVDEINDQHIKDELDDIKKLLEKLAEDRQ